MKRNIIVSNRIVICWVGLQLQLLAADGSTHVDASMQIKFKINLLKAAITSANLYKTFATQSVASSVQSDDNNNKCYKTKKKKIEFKFKESFSINAFDSTITKAKIK